MMKWRGDHPALSASMTPARWRRHCLSRMMRRNADEKCHGEGACKHCRQQAKQQESVESKYAVQKASERNQ